MPAEPLFPNSTVLHRRKQYDDEEFMITIYTNPSDLPDEELYELILRFGDSSKYSLGSLHTSKQVVSDFIEQREYSAILFVENTHRQDYTKASLQYFDWLDSGSPQLWINDIRRITSSKGYTSPTKVLFDVIGDICSEYKLPNSFLFVDKEPTKEAAVLCDIYKRYGYQKTSEEVLGSLVLSKLY